MDKSDTIDQIALVQQYISRFRITYPVGIEETDTYGAIARNFPGVNPFPVTVIVGRDGNIVHIAREYDPDRIEAVLNTLLP